VLDSYGCAFKTLHYQVNVARMAACSLLMDDSPVTGELPFSVTRSENPHESSHWMLKRWKNNV
jgi:hypothetical protein